MSDMAAFFRKILHQGRQVCPIGGSLLNNVCKSSITIHGNGAKASVKALGLLSYSQRDNGHGIWTARSSYDCPELSGTSIGSGAVREGAAAAASHAQPRIFPLTTSSEQSAPSLHLRAVNLWSYTTGFHRSREERTSLTTTLNAGSRSRSLSTYIDSFPFGRYICNNSSSLRENGSNQCQRGLCHHALYRSLHFLIQRTGNTNTRAQQRRYATRPKKPISRKKEKSYYEILSITPHATQAQVKEAYIKLSKIYHPDKNAGSKDAQQQFASINEAYSVLGNLTLRKRYDRGTLSQRDVHGEVSEEEKMAEEKMKDDPMYTGSGVPFSVEAKRQAKNMDDFFSKHYKEALDKEQRDRAERKQRIDEYMELQQRAKLSPVILAVFMLMAIVMATKSVSSNSLDKKLRGANNNKDKQ